MHAQRPMSSPVPDERVTIDVVWAGGWRSAAGLYEYLQAWFAPGTPFKVHRVPHLEVDGIVVRKVGCGVVIGAVKGQGEVEGTVALLEVIDWWGVRAETVGRETAKSLGLLVASWEYSVAIDSSKSMLSGRLWSVKDPWHIIGRP